IDPATYAMDVEAAAGAITPRTRAIMPVHLYGHPAPMDRVVELARAHRLSVVEDAAQAVGGAWAERPIGAWGDAACLSFYPTKNLGACGDGGMVLTDRPDVAERVAKLRHHGDRRRHQHDELCLVSTPAPPPGWTSCRRRCCPSSPPGCRRGRRPAGGSPSATASSSWARRSRSRRRPPRRDPSSISSPFAIRPPVPLP